MQKVRECCGLAARWWLSVLGYTLPERAVCSNDIRRRVLMYVIILCSVLYAIITGVALMNRNNIASAKIALWLNLLPVVQIFGYLWQRSLRLEEEHKRHQVESAYARRNVANVYSKRLSIITSVWAGCVVLAIFYFVFKYCYKPATDESFNLVVLFITTVFIGVPVVDTITEQLVFWYDAKA